MRFSIIYFVLFFYSALLLSQEIKTGPRPTWATPIQYTDDSDKNYTSKGLHYLLTSEQSHMEIKEDYYKIVYKITNSNGVSEGASIQIFFDPLYQKVVIHNIQRIRNGGKSTKIKPDFLVFQQEKNAEINIYDGTYTAIMNLKDVRVGDIIELEYSIQGQNPLYEGFFSKTFNLAGFYSIAHQNIRITADKSRKLNVYSSENKNYTPAYNGNNVIYEINLLETKAIKYDEQTPGWYNFSDFVIFTEFDKQPFANWVTKLFTINPTEYQSAAQKANQLTQNIDDKRKKIETLINFVQDEVRYLSLSTGIGAYKPRGPIEVLNDRFGDCKDKSLLLSTMLNSIGIDAQPVLVNSYRGKRIIDLPLGPMIFDHCIVRIEQDNTSYWIDPTINNQEGSLSDIYFPDYGAGFIISDTSRNLIEIPFRNKSRFEIKQDYYIKDKNSPVKFDVVSEYYKADADRYREYFQYADITDIETNYLEHYERFNNEVKFDKKMETLDYKETNMFKVSESYIINNFWSNTEGEQINEKSIFAEIIYDNMTKEFQKRRSSPLALNYPLEIIQRIYIHMPSDIIFPTDWQTVENEFFKFSRNLNYSQQTIIFTCKFKLLSDHVPLDKIDLYKNDIDKAISLLGIEVYAPRNSIYESSANDHLNWFFIVVGIIMLLVFIYLANLLNKRYDPPSIHYRHRYEKLEGILWFIFIGLLISPLITIFNLFNGIYFNNTTWASLISPGSMSYNPFMAFILLIDYIIIIFHIVFSSLIIYQFLKKRSSLRILITVFYAFNLSYAFLLIILHNVIGLDMNSNPGLGFLKAFIAAAIWIPFFQVSNRAKETFVHQRKQKTEQLISA